MRSLRLAFLVCLAALQAAVLWAGPKPKPDGLAITTGLPGAGMGISERGLPSNTGATTLNLPLGYTLSSGESMLSLWDGTAGGPGKNVQAAFSLGFGPASDGLSITGYATDMNISPTMHVQKQLWGQVGPLPAVSAGVIDLQNRFRRSYYVSGTRRFGPNPTPLRAVLTAATPSWPPGPVPPSPGNPATWGTLTLSDQRLDKLTQVAETDKLQVPLSSFPPLLDGVLGTDWDDAAKARIDLSDGSFLLVGAKHTEGALYVAVAAPSDRVVPHAASLRLYLEAPRAASRVLTVHHRMYRVEWSHVAPTEQQFTATADRGEWREQKAYPDTKRPPERFTAKASGNGDGAWSYPVFEVCIPFKEMGLATGDDIGFAAVLSLSGGAAAEPPVAPKSDQEVLCWPLGRALGHDPVGKIFLTRPDQWGAVVLSDKAPGKDRIAAPQRATAPELDGRIADKEYAGADKRTAEVIPGVEQTLYALRAEGYLYLALVIRAQYGQPQSQVTEVVLDPNGDGGLAPRTDDRLVRIEDGPRGLRVETFSWNEKTQQWTGRESLPVEVARAVIPASAGFESGLELRLPLSELQPPERMKHQWSPGVGLQTTLKTAPAHLVSAGRPAANEPGKATYVTVAWGTDIYNKRVMAGVSYPVGNWRGVTEYDGIQVNVGMSGRLLGRPDFRLTVGYTGVNGTADGGPLVGLAFGHPF
jgi:hypothetical protein